MADEHHGGGRAPHQVRLDVWLWSVRAFRTRTSATDACRAGKVSVNGETAKAAQRVAVGDRVEFRRAGDRFVYELVTPISKRVGAALAAAAFIDHSPPRVERIDGVIGASSGERERGAGRPTKRDRRRIDELKRSGTPHRRA